MDKLSSSKRSYLKSEAHHLKPIILIGKKGLTDGAIEAINNALEAREIIKIQFRELKNEKKNFQGRLQKKLIPT